MKKTLTLLLLSASALLSAGVEKETKDFIATIQLGQHLLERKLVAPHFSPIQRHFQGAVKKISAMSPENARRELEAFEDVMLQLSARCTGQPYSPNVGWYTKKRLAEYEKDLLETHADWTYNSRSLARFGLKADAEFEWKRLQELRRGAPKLKTLPLDPRFDRAFSFYKQIAEERFRLGGQIILFENELDALLRTAEFRQSLGGAEKKLSADPVRSLLKQWREAYNRKDYLRCAQLEKRTAELIAELKKQVFASDGKTPDLRPGTSFLSTGIFGFGGNWQPLLNTNVRYGNLYLSRENDFRMYENSKFDWEVSFDAENANCSRYEIDGGSWTYAKRKNFYRNSATGKEEIIDVYWSALAPGVLFDAHAKAVAVVEGSLGVPVAPDAVAGVFDGKVRLIPRGTPIPSRSMSEGWLLLLWNANNAPKLPVLLFFEHAPDQLEWGGGGFRIVRSPEVGKYAAATLYGAVAQKPDFGKNWNSLPADVLKQCRAVARHLAFYPLDVDEFFAFGKNGTVRIWNKIRKAVRLDGNWNVKAPAYVPFPPAYTLTNAVRPDQPLSEPLMATRFGFYRTVPGEVISYSLSAPDLLERFVLRPVAGEERYIKQLNDTILAHKGGNAWDNFVRDYRSGQVLELAAGFCMLREEARELLNQQKLPGQLELSITGEMSTSGARELDSRSRLPDYLVDPNTGRSAFLGGWRGRNQGGEGSGRGDMTLFNQLPLFHAYGQAVLFGRWDLIERYWTRLKDLYSAVDFNQPWQTPGMNTLTSGVILYGDMYGDGFRCYNLMYRLARGMGDSELADRARYLAAKQTATTINFLSPNVIAYNAHVKNLPDAASPDAAIGQLGISQYGFRTAPWKPYPKNAWNAPFQTIGCTNDYPFYGILLRYCFPDSKRWLDTFAKAIPEWHDPVYLYEQRAERQHNAWNYLKYLAMSSRDRQAVRALYEKAFPADYSKTKPLFSFRGKQWEALYKRLHMREWFMRGNVLPHIIGQNDPLWIGDFGRAHLVSGVYDREKRSARIELTSGRPDTLTVVSMVRPSRILRNGTPVEIRHGDWECAYEIPLPAGNNTVELSLPEFRVEEFPFPKKGAPSPVQNLPKAPAPQKLQRKASLPSVFKVGPVTALDLAPFCNIGFSDSPENMVRKEFWVFPRKDVIRGVPFTFVDPAANGGKGMIALRGRYRKTLPEMVCSIPVNKVPKRIFFLHGMCYNADNGKVMTYRLNFADGQTREIDVYAGIGVGEWKVAPGGKTLAELPEALTGKIYPAAKSGQWGEGAGGYVYVWTNNVRTLGVTNQDVDQRSLATLKSIDLISAGRAVPLLFAITLEE